MASYLKSNVFSDVYIGGNCIVKGNISSLGGSITSQWTTTGSAIYYTTGNVGIGTTNPQNSLTVYNSGVSISNLSSGTTSTAAYYAVVNTADNRRAFVGMDGTGLFAFSTGALALGTDNTPIIFAPSYGSGEKMRILTTGYVGIGTTNPGSLLTVSGGVGIGSGYNAFTAPTGGLIVQGNVGIGTTNPGVNALQVSGNVVTSGFTSNATNTVFNFDTLTVPFLNATQVGVGTTAPDNTIDAVGSIVAAPVTFLGASNYGLFFRRGFSTSNFYNCSVMAYDHSGDTNPDGISINGYDGVSICTGSNTRQERVRILGTNGYVGIGTASPGGLLHVNASVINPTVPTVHIGDNANDYGATYGMVHLVRSATPGDTKAHLTMIRSGQTGVNFGYYNNTNTFGMWRALQTTASTPTISISNSSDWVGIGTTNPGYTLDANGDVNSGGSYRINGVLQPKIPSSLQGSWTAVSSVTITGIDLATAFYSAEIRLNWYKNGSAGNNGNVSFSFKDTGGNSLGLQEAYTYEWRNGGTTANTGSVGYLASGAEPVGGDYGSVIRVWSVRPGSGSRYHYTFESVGCYANIGATTNRGEGFVTVVSGTVNAIVISCSSGTFGGVYSVVQYI